MVTPPLRIGVGTEQNGRSRRKWELLAGFRKDIRFLVFNEPADVHQPAIFDPRVEMVPRFDPSQCSGDETLAREPGFGWLERQQVGQMISAHPQLAVERRHLLWQKRVDFEFLFSQGLLQ